MERCLAKMQISLYLYMSACMPGFTLFTCSNSHFETLWRDSVLTTEKKQVILWVCYSGSHSGIISFDKVYRVGLLRQVTLALWCSRWPEAHAPWNLPMRTVTAFYTKNICTGKRGKTLNIAVSINRFISISLEKKNYRNPDTFVAVVSHLTRQLGHLGNCTAYSVPPCQWCKNVFKHINRLGIFMVILQHFESWNCGNMSQDKAC